MSRLRITEIFILYKMKQGPSDYPRSLLRSVSPYVVVIVTLPMPSRVASGATSAILQTVTVINPGS